MSKIESRMASLTCTVDFSFVRCEDQIGNISKDTIKI